MNTTDAVYGYSLTISFLVVVLLSPILSALADTIGNKKSFLQFFCYLCYFLYGIGFVYQYAHCFSWIIIQYYSQYRFWGSLVFYNSFLPDIATPDQQDALSAKGYIYGYIGYVILVVICLLLIMVVAQTPKQAMILTRISFSFNRSMVVWFLPVHI
jgi:UMF1 family MFS transporter